MDGDGCLSKLVTDIEEELPSTHISARDERRTTWSRMKVPQGGQFMNSEEGTTDAPDERKPAPGEVSPIPAAGVPAWGLPSNWRLATGVVTWCLLQVVLILTAPTIGGNGSVVGYGVVTTTSILASWLLPFVLLRAKPRASTVLLIAISIGLGWLFNPVRLYHRPVYPDEAYGYYLALAGWGMVVGVPVFQLSVNLLRSISDRRTPGSSLAVDLRRRARIYRDSSRRSLCAIIGAIAVGAAIFILADGIAAGSVDRRLGEALADLRAVQGQQSEVGAAVDSARSHSELAVVWLARLDTVLAVDRDKQHAVEAAVDSARFRSDFAPSQMAQLDSILTAAREQQQAVQAFVESVRLQEQQLKNNLDRVAEGLGRLAPRLGDGTDSLTEMVTKIAQDHQEDETLRAILSSLSTRVGAVLLIVFLVQILAGLYRYSARMAAHHESQADVLSLGDGVTHAEVIELLSRTHVDFGKTPDAPTSQMKEVVTSVIEAFRAKP